MVETWRWPNASYSVLSICEVEMPSRAAVSRSIDRSISNPLSCWSEFTSSSSGTFCSAAVIFGTQALSSSSVSA